MCFSVLLFKLFFSPFLHCAHKEVDELSENPVFLSDSPVVSSIIIIIVIDEKAEGYIKYNVSHGSQC